MRAAASALVAALLFACSTSSSSHGTLAVCSSLPVDAGSACSVNEALLQCTNQETGASETCLSDNVNACPDSDPSFVGDCKSLCPLAQYAAACGGLPSSDASAPPIDPPSPKCTAQGTSPGGVAYYCCPCGS